MSHVYMNKTLFAIFIKAYFKYTVTQKNTPPDMSESVDDVELQSVWYQVRIPKPYLEVVKRNWLLS